MSYFTIFAATSLSTGLSFVVDPFEPGYQDLVTTKCGHKGILCGWNNTKRSHIMFQRYAHRNVCNHGNHACTNLQFLGTDCATDWFEHKPLACF